MGKVKPPCFPSHMSLLSCARESRALISLRYASCYTQAETARVMRPSQQAVSRCGKGILEKLRKNLLSNQIKIDALSCSE